MCIHPLDSDILGLSSIIVIVYVDESGTFTIRVSFDFLCDYVYLFGVLHQHHN